MNKEPHTPPTILWTIDFVEFSIAVLSQGEELKMNSTSKKNVKNKCYGNKLPVI